MNGDGLTETQVEWYTDSFKKHGPSIEAVAGTCPEQKKVRHMGLSQLFKDDDNFSLHDAGVGLGHYGLFLQERYPEKNIAYSGSDIVPDFVAHCRKAYIGSEFFLHDISKAPLPRKYDYIVLGGLFTRLFGKTPKELSAFMKTTIANSFASANRGVSFYVMTEYVDYRYENLFYPKIYDLIKFIVKDISRFFCMHHAFPLYEHTLCIYRKEFIRSRHPQEALAKYFNKNQGDVCAGR